MPLTLSSMSTALLALIVLVTFAEANTALACSEIAALKTFETQTYQGASSLLNHDYEYAKHHYWNAANGDLNPACVVFPTSAQDVSEIVEIITKYDGVKFAVKGGGHNANVGFSSTDGVLIAMSSIATTTLSDDKTIAHVGSGSRWEAVELALKPHGLMAVGGRIGDVGVGGFTLGGGLSFMSAAHGFACDNVVNYEVVLANASIVNANENENRDLFWALKGGGNQFGIVTRFDMTTYPIGQIWGGVRMYAGHYHEAIMNATQDFTENFHDNKAAVIVTAEIAIESLVEIFVVFFFYNGTDVPDGVFDKFDAIRAFYDSTETQGYADLLVENNHYNVYGLRYLIRGATIPLLPSPMGSDLLNYHYKTWKEFIIKEGALHPDFIYSVAFQPLPVAIAEASLAKGGNAIALNPDAGAHIWLSYDISWLTKLGDDHANQMAISITDSIDAYAKSTYKGVKPVGYVEQNSNLLLQDEEFLPIFMNDAMYDQKPAQSYGNGSFEKLCAINKKYDPEGFLNNRTGGFKYDSC